MYNLTPQHLTSAGQPGTLAPGLGKPVAGLGQWGRYPTSHADRLPALGRLVRHWRTRERNVNKAAHA